MWDYEPPSTAGRRASAPARRRPPANATAVWEVGSAIEDGAAGIHPTQKPVELISRPIDCHTLPDEAIYEPFCGSGTALIAAEMSGRACYAIECAPQFVDVALARWQQFSGRKATGGRDGGIPGRDRTALRHT